MPVAGRRVRRAALIGPLATTAGLVLGLVVVYATAPLSGRSQTWGIVVGFGALAAVVPVLVRRIRAVLRADKPVAEAVAAIAVAFTLMVLGSASTYFAMASGDPGQFQGLVTKVDAVYFAVTVMSTVGFGDVVPVGQAARMVTTFHIIANLSLVGGALRLVTWAARRRLDADGRSLG